MRSSATGINRFVALVLAIVWCCAGVAGMVVALARGRPLLVLFSLFALCYAILWFRAVIRSRLVSWKELALPWRARPQALRNVSARSLGGMLMTTALTYVIKFVRNMDAAIEFHVAHLGLKLRFGSPEWSEFETGPTTLALHRASAEHPPGTCQLGFHVADVDRFYSERIDQGLEAVSPPTDLHGHRMAKLRDLDGAEFSVSAP